MGSFQIFSQVQLSDLIDGNTEYGQFALDKEEKQYLKSLKKKKNIDGKDCGDVERRMVVLARITIMSGEKKYYKQARSLQSLLCKHIKSYSSETLDLAEKALEETTDWKSKPIVKKDFQTESLDKVDKIFNLYLELKKTLALPAFEPVSDSCNSSRSCPTPTTARNKKNIDQTTRSSSCDSRLIETENKDLIKKQTYYRELLEKYGATVFKESNLNLKREQELLETSNYKLIKLRLSRIEKLIDKEYHFSEH